MSEIRTVSKHLFRRTARDQERRLQVKLDRAMLAKGEGRIAYAQNLRRELLTEGVPTTATGLKVTGRMLGWWRVVATR